MGDQRSAKYTNLNAGTYTFYVKGSNNDGVWNNDGQQLTIIQLAPPWVTWWAYALYAICLITIIAWFIYHQRHKRKIVEEQNRILEARVAEIQQQAIEYSLKAGLTPDWGLSQKFDDLRHFQADRLGRSEQ